MTTLTTSAWNPLAVMPAPVLRLAYWAQGSAEEREVLFGDYLGCLERLTDPQLLDECLLVGLLHATPEVRRQAQAAAARLSPELADEATGWTLGDPDETVRAAALAAAGGASALRALLDLFGRSAQVIATGAEGCVTVTDARALAAARKLLADTALAAEVFAELPVPLTADRLPSRLSVSGMHHIPAGRLVRGLRPDQPPTWGDPAPAAVAEVAVEGFYLDVHPVTNEEYDAFVADVDEVGHLWCHADEPKDASHTRSTADDPRCAADHPVTGIDWYDAMAYAAWAGKRLPTEDEWERAARGDDHRRYPWGEEFIAGQVRGLHAVLAGTGGAGGAGGAGREDWLRQLERLEVDALPELTGPVGHYPQDESPFGIRDMCGNVWEWTSTRFLDGLPLESRFGTMGAGDLWGEWSAEASIRGGAWSSPSALLTSVARAGKPLVTRSPEIGFRCAVSESEVAG